MTRKHFNAIAAAIAEIEDAWMRRNMALTMANVCARFNDAFDRARFLEACRAA